jgi:pantetheine-phosphate adenylyltransferase
MSYGMGFQSAARRSIKQISMFFSQGEAMKRAIYPGSFDPVTFGHLDVIERSLKIADELIVGVLDNSVKSSLFSVEERVTMLREVTASMQNVKVQAFQGLLVDFAMQSGADIVVRGLRAITDFEYELQMAQTNHELNQLIDTVFLTTRLQYAYLSSSTVKEVARMRGRIEKFVPEPVVLRLYQKYGVCGERNDKGLENDEQ